tara:strand:- start:3082 stop:3270 length:189 start_codon:yes stop_codon:yes gene_type:complete
MKKVKSKYYGIVHSLARCDNCDWDGDDLDVGKTRKNARDHVRETGHVVHVETGTSTRYELKA